MVHLYNDILLGFKKNDIKEFAGKWMEFGKKKSNPEWGNPDPEREIWYDSLISGYQLLYISALFSSQHRGFLLQQMGTNTETYSRTLWGVAHTLEHIAWNKMSPSNPSPPSSGNSKETDGVGWGDKGTEDTRTSPFLSKVHMYTQTEAAAQGWHGSAPGPLHAHHSFSLALYGAPGCMKSGPLSRGCSWSSLSSCLPGLSNSNVMVSILYYILFCYVSLLFLRSLFFSNERQKGSGCGWERRWGETERSIGKGNCIQIILYEKRNYV